MKTPFVFSLKMKFAVTASALVAVCSILWGTWVWQGERQHLFEKLEAEGRLMLNSLQAPIINTIIYEELGIATGLLDDFIQEIIENPEIPAVHAYITDSAGRVIAHNRAEEAGKTYRDPLTLATLAGTGFRKVLRNEAGVLEMGIPLQVHGKSWGALRIGLSTVSLKQKLEEVRREVIFFSAFFFVLGSVLFYLVGLAMARPLEKLTDIMMGVRPDALSHEKLNPRRDEIGLLEKTFQEMLNRLQKAEIERKEALFCLVQNEKMAVMGKIVAGVAHEINNPLAALAGAVFKIRNNHGDMETSLDTLEKGISRIEAIVGQLNDFSRAGALEAETIRSDDFFSEARGFGEMALIRENVKIVARDECAPVLLRVDRGKIQQVILNLLINAADASPPGGVVEMVSSCDDNCYCIRVTDRGHGVPKEDFERIFDIFYTTKGAGKGTGIGLAICKSIIELHNGSLSLESQPGETTFFVKIPIERK